MLAYRHADIWAGFSQYFSYTGDEVISKTRYLCASITTTRRKYRRRSRKRKRSKRRRRRSRRNRRRSRRKTRRRITRKRRKGRRGILLRDAAKKKILGYRLVS